MSSQAARIRWEASLQQAQGRAAQEGKPSFWTSAPPRCEGPASRWIP